MAAVEPGAVVVHVDGGGAAPAGGGGGGGGAGGAAAPAKKVAPPPSCGSRMVGCLCKPCLAFLAQFNNRDKEAQAERKERERKEMWKQKRFYYKVDKISAVFESKMDSAFLEFEMGGQIQETTTEEAVAKKVKKKRNNKEGKPTEVEGTEYTYKKALGQVKPKSVTFYTRMKKIVRPKEPEAFIDHSFEGFWDGTYADMFKEFLRVRIWHKRWWGTNVLIGESKESFQIIANGKMDREVQVLKKLPGAQVRMAIVATLRYKVEFQELFEFNINFKDWQVELAYGGRTVEKAKKKKTIPPRAWLEFEVARSKGSCLDNLGISCFFARQKSTLDAIRSILSACMPCLQDNDAALKVRDGASLAQMSLRYPGTRAWLEDEAVRIKFYRALCCYSCAWPFCPIAEKKVDLQGTLDYGFITAEFEEYGWAKGMIDGNKVVDRPLPAHRQLGNVDPSGEESIFVTREKATYLVVKVLRAKGLFIPRNDEFKETLNPTVTVGWMSIKKTTRLATETADPFWDDELFFKIPDKECRGSRIPRVLTDFNMKVQTSVITLSVWDNDNLGRTPLGYFEVDFAKMFRERKKTGIISFASKGHKVDRFVYSSGEVKLVTPFAEGVDFVKHDREDAKIPEEKIETPAAEGEKKPRVVGRHIEFQVYFDRSDKKLIPCKTEVKGPDLRKEEQARKDFKARDIPFLRPDMIRKAEDFWNEALKIVPDREKRFFPFYGQDEYSGKFHFLPTFVKPIQPPTDLRFKATLLYFIFSIECMRRKEELHPLTTRARQVWMWSDPYFFLDKRKGDIKDHAILLCNFLLGLGKNAFVCVGTARQKDLSKPPIPHVWVMTQEPRKGYPPDSKPTDTTRKQNHIYGYDVRFWETTDGKCYLLPDRFQKLNDREPYEGESDDDLAAEQKEEAEKAAKELGDSGEGDEAAGDADEKPEEADDERRPLTPAGVRRDDEKRTGTLGSGAEKKSSAPGAKKKGAKGKKGKKGDAAMEEKKEEKEEEKKENSEDEDDADREVLGETVDTLINPKHTRPAAAFSSSDEKKHSHMGVLRTNLMHQRNLQVALAIPGLTDEKKKVHLTPYATIDVVFNHQRMYANLQLPDPELINYQFNNRQRWVEFKQKHYKEYFGIPKLKPFYPDRALISLMSGQQDVEDLQLLLGQRLKDAISTLRDFDLRMETKFIHRFEFQKIGSIDETSEGRTAQDHMQKRLENEFRYGDILDKGLELQDLIDLPEFVAERKAAIEDKPDYVKNAGYRKQWREQITDFLEPTHIYREQLLHFKHSDSNRISEQVLTQAKAILTTKEVFKPEFAISVKIHRMPAFINPVRVLVVCISLPPREYRGEPLTLVTPPPPPPPTYVAPPPSATTGSGGGVAGALAAGAAGAAVGAVGAVGGVAAAAVGGLLSLAPSRT